MAAEDGSYGYPVFGLTWPKLLTGAGVLVGGLWAVLTVTLGSISDRVNSIDDRLSSVSGSIEASVAKSHETETALRGLISDHKLQMEKNTAALDRVTDAVKSLGADVANMDFNMALIRASVERSDFANYRFQNYVVRTLSQFSEEEPPRIDPPEPIPQN